MEDNFKFFSKLVGKCLVCGKLLTGQQKKYCSVECTKKYINANPKLSGTPCRVCGSNNVRFGSTFCSYSCRYKSHIIDGTKKKCTKCGSIKTLDLFYKGSNVCKECFKINVRNNYVKNDHKIKSKQRRFNLDDDEYYGLMVSHGNRCAICGNEETVSNQYGKISLSIDHNHETGKVRGLLCCNCNRALGLFRDSKDLLTKAIKYLNERN
jgi:hypothetical protein